MVTENIKGWLQVINVHTSPHIGQECRNAILVNSIYFNLKYSLRSLLVSNLTLFCININSFFFQSIHP